MCKFSSRRAELMEILGKYVVNHYENVKEYYAARGMGFAAEEAELFLMTQPKVMEEISKLGDEDWYRILNVQEGKVTKELVFKLGVAFVEHVPYDGIQYQSTFYMEQNKLKQIQKSLGYDGPDIITWRKFTPNGMELIMEAPGSTVTMTAFYDKLEQ